MGLRVTARCLLPSTAAVVISTSCKTPHKTPTVPSLGNPRGALKKTLSAWLLRAAASALFLLPAPPGTRELLLSPLCIASPRAIWLSQNNSLFLLSEASPSSLRCPHAPSVLFLCPHAPTIPLPHPPGVPVLWSSVFPGLSWGAMELGLMEPLPLGLGGGGG